MNYFKFKIKFLRIFSFLGLLGLLFSPSSVLAATTVGPNITTAGDLTVNGALKFTSGAAANYILTTDAAGNATWISVGTALGSSDTDSLPEGAANLYYTDVLLTPALV